MAGVVDAENRGREHGLTHLLDAHRSGATFSPLMGVSDGNLQDVISKS